MKTHKKYGIWILLLVSVIALSGCGASTPTNGGTSTFPVSKLGTKVTVSMKNSVFTPATATVKAGTTVVWTNDDSLQHTVFASGAFDDILLQPGETFSFTFKNVGTFDYVSTLSKEMIGKIIVQ